MKLITALAALSLIAAPAQAMRFTSDAEQKQMLALMTQVAEASKTEDWATACKTYQKYIDFRVSIDHHDFYEIEGSQKKREILRKMNAITAKLNAGANRKGPQMCGMAGLAWGRAPLPEQPSDGVIRTNASSVSQNIRERCERKWGTDYEMIRYCVDNQTEAARSLGY